MSRENLKLSLDFKKREEIDTMKFTLFGLNVEFACMSKGLDNCGIIRVSFMLSPLSLDRSHKILWEDAWDIYGAKIRFLLVCQHSKDRTAGEKRKQKDAEEVLYIIFSFYLQPLCYCHLWLANSKGQIHTWMGHMTLISEYFYDKRDNSSILAKLKMV